MINPILLKTPNHTGSNEPVALVFDSPHSGTTYPENFQYSIAFAALRAVEDTYVDELFSAAPEAGAQLISATFPRSYIDPNRSILDIDNALFEQAWPGPVSESRKTELGIGLIWRLTDSGVGIYDRKLTHQEVMERIRHYHQPYQKAVKDAIDKNVTQFGSSWHVNCHSMTAIGGAISDDVGISRADFVLGDRDSTTCDREFTYLIYGFLRGLGYDVKINDPYKGVELVSAFSNPAEHRHSIQIEINRRLYLNETTREKTSGFLPLQADITKLVAMLADYAKDQTEHVEHHCAHHDHGHHHNHGHAHQHEPHGHEHSDHCDHHHHDDHHKHGH